MGSSSSKDTRRISFDNTFALSLPITVQKSIEKSEMLQNYNDVSVSSKCNEFPDLVLNIILTVLEYLLMMQDSYVHLKYILLCHNLCSLAT